MWALDPLLKIMFFLLEIFSEPKEEVAQYIKGIVGLMTAICCRLQIFGFDPRSKESLKKRECGVPGAKRKMQIAYNE